MQNELLRLAREIRGWTQTQLAEKLGVGQSTVRSWESGLRTPILQQRLRLCNLFGMTATQLGFEQDATEQQPRDSNEE
jgi:transcriptional regulator with XRE-family HTH domain